MKNLKIHELTLKSDTFDDMVNDIDEITNRTIFQMREMQLDEAEVTVKIKVSTASKEIGDPTSDNINAKRTAIVPTFEHTVSSILKIKDEQKGQLSGNFELVFDPETGKYIMVDIGSNQTSMFDEDQVQGEIVNEEDADDETADDETALLGGGQRYIGSGEEMEETA